MKYLLIGSVIILALFGSGCSLGYRKSVGDAEEAFVQHREAYQALAEAALAAPRLPGQNRNTVLDWHDPAFDSLDTTPPFGSAVVPPEGTAPRWVEIEIYTYGMAVSGRTVGLAYFEGGRAPEFPPGSYRGVVEDCGELDSAANRRAFSYCPLGDGWYAFRHSF